MGNRLPRAAFFPEADVRLLSAASCGEAGGSPSPERNLWFAIAPAWLEKMLSLSFVTRAYWLRGQWRRKKPGSLGNEAHLCIILKLVWCAAICGRMTAVTNFSLWRGTGTLHLKVGNWLVIIFRVVLSLILISADISWPWPHYWLYLLLKALCKCFLFIWNR